MPKNKEIEITLTLRDEASKKIQSFRSSVKEFGNAAKDTVQPLLQMRQAWMRVGLASGFVLGSFAKVAQEISLLRKEIETLDVSAVKLGTSFKQLSLKVYGFDIGSEESRLGTLSIAEIQKSFSDARLKMTKEVAESIGRSRIDFEKERIYNELLAKRGYSSPDQKTFGSFLGGSPIANFPSLEERRKLLEEAERLTKEHFEQETQAFKEAEAIKKGVLVEVVQKTKQLTMSSFDYKKTVLNQEVDLYRNAGVDKISLANYEAAAMKRLDEDRTIAFTNQQAVRLKAEGMTLEAMRIEQENALIVFKRQFSEDGEMVNEFLRGQQAIYEQAQLSYLGLKSEFQTFHDSYVSLVGSMTSTFSDLFYNTVTGQINNLTDVFNDFGQAVLKNLSDIIAQILVMRMVSGLASLAGGFLLGPVGAVVGGIGGNVLSTGAQSIAGHAFSTAWSPYHSGGVVRAHSGLAIDEVPIIAQRGEGVLSRRGMSALGRGNFDRLNNGAGISGRGEVVNNHFTININAVDAASFEELCKRNPGGITSVAKAAIFDDYRRQGPVSKISRR